MATKKFDLLVEKLLSEGRRPKQQKLVVIDFPKLEEYLNQMSDDNFFKAAYTAATNKLKSAGSEGEFTNEEMMENPKTQAEWLNEIELSYAGNGIDNATKKKLAIRFYEFLNDKDRNFMIDYDGQSSDSLDTSSDIENKIFTFIKNSDGGASEAEIYEYAARYGKDESAVDDILSKFVDSGEISLENGLYSADVEESEVEPEDSELESEEDDDVSDDIFDTLDIDPEEESDDARDMYSRLRHEEEGEGFK